MPDSLLLQLDADIFVALGLLLQGHLLVAHW
jgi:hypothetical protein